MMIKIYYDNTRENFLCNRYPKDIPVVEGVTPYIEVDEETADETYIIETGKFWAVIDNKLQKIDDFELINTKEYINEQIRRKIALKKAFLTSTDYIITKLNESKIQDIEEEFIALKEKYATELKERKKAREEINALEAQLNNKEVND